MFKHWIFLTIPLLVLGCKSSEEAVYKQLPEHKLLNESQLVDEVKANPDSVKNVLSGVQSKIKSNFNWNNFWALSDSNSLQATLDLENFNHLVQLATQTCSPSNFDSINKLIFNYNFSNKKSEANLVNFYSSQLSLYRNCYRSGMKLSREDVKRVNSHVKEIKSDKFTNALMSIVKTDSMINRTSNFTVNRFNTFSAREFVGFIKRNSENTSLENFSQLLRLHKEMSPFSSRDRAELVVHFLGNEEKRKKVVEVSTIEELNNVVSEISKEEEVNVPSKTISFLINSIISKIESTYRITSRFDDLEQVISLLWRDYSKLYNNLNQSDQLVKNKKELLLVFNKANKVFENIIKLPINRSVAIDYLESVKNTNELLSLSHLVKLKSRELYGFDLNEAIKIYSNIEKPTSLEKLLLNRLKIYSLEKKAYEKYCKLMKDEFKIDIATISENDIPSKLSSNTIGCYKVNFNSSLRPLTSTETTENAQYHQININKDIIDTNNDLLFLVPDSHLNIKASYYNGPIWVSASDRTLPVIDHKLPKLDAEVSPIVFKVKIRNNDKKYFQKDELLMIFNYASEDSRDVPPMNQIIDVTKLKQGFRGGNVNLTVKDRSSFFPFVFNKGGEGQPGPETLKAGQGFDVGSIEEKAYDYDDDFAEYMFESDNHQELTYPKHENINMLKNYNLSFDIDEWATKRLQKNLCGENVNLLKKICFIKGRKYVIGAPQNLEDAQHLFKEVRKSFSHLVSILHRAEDSKLLLKREFTFPPVQKDKKSVLKFPNGKVGKTGKVSVEIVN